ADAWETEYELQSTINPALRRMMVGVIAGLVIGAVASPIIEIAWRGLLYTELRWMGFAPSSLLVGVLAAVWWVPCLIMAPMGGAQTLTAGVRLAALALMGVPLAWLREATRSIIPGAVLVTSWVALLELPPMMLLDVSDLQTALITFTATGLLAGLALMWPPAAVLEPDEEAQQGE
ncbi:MAG: type II CAAX prenyl endopeptidase Rce1 family protein, partial [Armatimonadota bacterium]